MPTYFCTTLEGRLTADQKSNIAGEITRIHCEVTGAPSFFCAGHLPGGEAQELLHWGARRCGTIRFSSTGTSEAGVLPSTSRG
jgi:hypothetical protein